MTHIFPRHTAMRPPRAVAGDGCYIIDSTGKRYLDASGGAAVSCLGHSDRTVTEAVKRQLDTLAFAHTGFFTTDIAEDLADLLIENAPEGLDRVYLVSGGSEATEAAIKLARQYHLERGDASRARIIARRQSYHGNTLGALSAGGNMWRREPFKPLLVDMSHIAPCYAYRGQADGESEADYGRRVADELEAEILRLGPETVAAFIAEPVVGATLGAVPAVEGYFKRIREICDRHGVLLILDEVMGSAPATSRSARCCAAAKIYRAIEEGSGFFQHGHTYIGHPAAAAAGHAVVSSLLERDLVTRARTMGETVKSALVERFGQHPHVGDIRGRGMFLGLELVEDRETKAPFDPARKLHAAIKKAAFARGLVCYPMGGTLDGRSGDHVLLAPPFILEDAQVEELVDKLSGAITDALAH
eukprot:jgi/Tetstr1/431554/TSEL_002206.t1